MLMGHRTRYCQYNLFHPMEGVNAFLENTAEDRGACAQHILYIRLVYTHLFWILEPFSTLKGLAEWYLWPHKCCFHWAHDDISQRSAMPISRHVVWYQAQRDSLTNVHPQLNTIPGDFFFSCDGAKRLHGLCDVDSWNNYTAPFVLFACGKSDPLCWAEQGAVPPTSTWCL